MQVYQYHWIIKNFKPYDTTKNSKFFYKNATK